MFDETFSQDEGSSHRFAAWLSLHRSGDQTAVSAEFAPHGVVSPQRERCFKRESRADQGKYAK